MKKRSVPCIASLVVLALAQGCMSPVSHTLTGRSYGRGKTGFDAGIILPIDTGPGIGPYISIKAGVGVSDDMDVGARFDYFSLGVFGRHSFISNTDQGPSVAGVMGLGLAGDGFYSYAGPTASYKSGFFEPYLSVRVNMLQYRGSHLLYSGARETGNYIFLQTTLGSSLWASRVIGGNIEGSVFLGERSVFGLPGHGGALGLTFRP